MSSIDFNRFQLNHAWTYQHHWKAGTEEDTVVMEEEAKELELHVS